MLLLVAYSIIVQITTAKIYFVIAVCSLVR